MSNAPDAKAECRRFRGTHPFHPLFGCEYELIEYRHFWAEDRVVYAGESGDARSLPAGWTSVLAEDPAVVVSAGRSHFRVGDLVELVKLVREAM